MTLERFQEATVEAALRALTVRSGSRRFLIADEVGLGKTVSAKAVAAELQHRFGDVLNIVYFCPNLDIAAQNLAKLQTLAPEWAKPEDRLSLVLQNLVPANRTKFRIYSYTPDTSLPGWKAAQRTGRAVERDLIAALLQYWAPRFWRRLRNLDSAREAEGRRTLFPPRPWNPPNHLKGPFSKALRQVMDLVGKPLDEGLDRWLTQRSGDVAELVLRARSALALAALRNVACRPHLLILDEFHRYADLIITQRGKPATELDRERRRVHTLLVDTLIGDGQDAPALLLLSATPYRLQRADRGEIPGGRYGHFVQVVRFLYGRAGAARVTEVEAAIKDHHTALERRDDPATALVAVADAKWRLETVLRPVIARTERATSIPGELFRRVELDSDLERRDLVTFRHLARAVDKKVPAMRSWVQPLWSSVPYPAEMLFNYQICKALSRDLPAVTISAEKGNPAHPKLRALIDPECDPSTTVNCDLLTLPWLAPTRPWWSLGGRWRELAESDRLWGKALLFSRYRGTPAAVSAWLSIEVDRRASRPQATKGKFTAQAYLRSDAKSPWPVIALFLPWPALSGAFEPIRDKDLPITRVKKHARTDLRDWLKSQDVQITSSRSTARKPWQVAFAIEGLVGDPTLISAILRELGGFVKPNAWPRSDARTITNEELGFLADWLLETPGAIIARTLRRHDRGLLSHTETLQRVFRFTWRQLRMYLGQRYFAGPILGVRRRRHGGSYPDALRQAMLDGCFEATIDEHLAVMALIGNDQPLDVLEDSLVGRPGLVQRRTTRGLRRARVHSAAPFLGADRKTSTRVNNKAERIEKLRSDVLRKGFNSPFWPHVLATTSIGQEGLDFHVWSDRVIHWDLPRDPVDFEQREGRIARYASLGVRRALADEYGNTSTAPWESPFAAIFKAARAAKREGLGLERWWSPTEHKPVSITFSLPFSLEDLRLNRLRDDLVRYRLALGQPEPELFERMVEHFGLTEGNARELALNLSPSVHSSQGGPR